MVQNFIRTCLESPYIFLGKNLCNLTVSWSFHFAHTSLFAVTITWKARKLKFILTSKRTLKFFFNCQPCAVLYRHYRNSLIRRVPLVHGEASQADGEFFADGGRRQPRGRQRPRLPCAIPRPHDKPIRRVFVQAHGERKWADDVRFCWRFGRRCWGMFAVRQGTWHAAKI